MADDIVGSIAVLIMMVVIYALVMWWHYVLLAALGLLILVGILAAADEWMEERRAVRARAAASAKIRPARSVIARGKLNDGSFVLVKSRLPDDWKGFPYLLTLTFFDSARRRSAAFARLVRDDSEEAPLVIGCRRGRIVRYDNNGRWRAPEVFMRVPENSTTRQIDPPLVDEATQLTSLPPPLAPTQ